MDVRAASHAAPPAERRPGGRSAAVRSAVLEATIAEVAECGLSNLSIARISARSGVHETSIYRRWGTRERLVLDAFTDRSANLLPVPDTGSITGDLVDFGVGLVDFCSTPLGEALLRSLAASNDDDAAAAARQRFWQERAVECRAMVDRAVARGELPARVDAQTLLELFVAPIHFRLLLTREHAGREFIELLAEVIVRGCT